MEKTKQNYEDILREIGNIGSGNAVTSLSQLLGLELELGLPSCQLVTTARAGFTVRRCFHAFGRRAAMYAGPAFEQGIYQHGAKTGDG